MQPVDVEQDSMENFASQISMSVLLILTFVTTESAEILLEATSVIVPLDTMDSTANTKSMNASPILVKMEQHVITYKLLFHVIVLLVLLEFSVRMMLMIVHQTLVFMEGNALMDWQTLLVNVR